MLYPSSEPNSDASKRQKASRKRKYLFQALLAAWFWPVACLAYASTLKMEAVRSEVRSVNLFQITRSHIPGDSTVHAYSASDCYVKMWCSLTFISSNIKFLARLQSRRLYTIYKQHKYVFVHIRGNSFKVVLSLCIIKHHSVGLGEPGNRSWRGDEGKETYYTCWGSILSHRLESILYPTCSRNKNKNTPKTIIYSGLIIESVHLV
jgi:hypothetical protein